MEKRIVTLRAVVEQSQEGVLTVRLEDGFANAQVIVHESKTAPV